jgi:predicted metalloprotease
MKLDDFDPGDVDVEDQLGGGGMGLPLGLGGGKIGCGGLVIALIAAAVFGVNPLQLLGALDQGTGANNGAGTGQVGGALPGQDGPRAGSSAAESCKVDEASRESCNALASLNKTWAPVFQKAGIAFSRPKLVFYAQQGQSGCGAAQSAMGPFYCPEDKGIYLDTDFYRQMSEQLGATGGFARDYVIAHEYGHHIQNLTGISDQVRAAQERSPSQANPLSVRLELQADCYAGVWAARNKDRLEPGDMESGLNAAHQIGDDTLMKGAGRNPVEAAFTHGSSAQRMKWLRTGMDSGNEDACDTFGAAGV